MTRQVLNSMASIALPEANAKASAGDGAQEVRAETQAKAKPIQQAGAADL